MRKFVFLVSVLSLACCICGHNAASAQDYAQGYVVAPCIDHGGYYSHWDMAPIRTENNQCRNTYTYHCCDGTIEYRLGDDRSDYWGCSLPCCICSPYSCGTYIYGPCPKPDTCTSAVSGEDTPDGCHYVINNYDCEGNYTGQTETYTGSPPDGRTCCESVPPDQCPAKQQVEYPAGSGNFYCKCGKVTWYDSEPWRQGQPSPPPPDTP